MSTAPVGVRAWLRTYLVALLVATAVIASGLVGVNVAYDRKIDSIERIEGLDLDEDTDPGEPANFLVIGSDTREFVETPEQEEAFGNADDEEGQRSDTIMVVQVDPRAGSALLVSFPRDLVVDIPEQGEQKINAAYGYGPNKVIETLKDNFGIDIHHYLEIDFAGFEGIVNAMGGVAVYFDAPARDRENGFVIGAPDLDSTPYYGWLPGCHELDGGHALGYVRSRTLEKYIEGAWRLVDVRADLDRIDRQQRFMRRLAADAVANALSSPLAANRIADRSLAKVKTDDTLTRSDINKLIEAFRRVDPNDEQQVATRTVPAMEDSDPRLGSVLRLLEDEAEPILAQLRTFEEPAVPAAGPPPSTIRVRVLNGSGVPGAAADAGDVLRAHAFQGGGFGDNPEPLDRTELRYRPGAAGKAEVVRSVLVGEVGELVEDATLVEADVELVLGTDFEGVASPAGAPPIETAAAPDTTLPPTSAAAATEPDEPPEDATATEC